MPNIVPRSSIEIFDFKFLFVSGSKCPGFLFEEGGVFGVDVFYFLLNIMNLVIELSNIVFKVVHLNNLIVYFLF